MRTRRAVCIVQSFPNQAHWDIVFVRARNRTPPQPDQRRILPSERLRKEDSIQGVKGWHWLIEDSHSTCLDQDSRSCRTSCCCSKDK